MGSWHPTASTTCVHRVRSETWCQKTNRPNENHITLESWTLKKKLTVTFVTILVMAGVLFSIAVINIGKMREATK